jgi:hypothetical protein
MLIGLNFCIKAHIFLNCVFTCIGWSTIWALLLIKVWKSPNIPLHCLKRVMLFMLKRIGTSRCSHFFEFWCTSTKTKKWFIICNRSLGTLLSLKWLFISKENVPCILQTSHHEWIGILGYWSNLQWHNEFDHYHIHVLLTYWYSGKIKGKSQLLMENPRQGI